MKAEIIRDGLQSALKAIPEGQEQFYEYKAIKQNRRTRQMLIVLSGAIIDDKDAYKLVWMGVAKPADEECAIACGQTPEEMAAAQKGFARLAAGIHPDDFYKFDAGIIVGYTADGSNGGYIPGPNYGLLDEDEEEDDEPEQPPLNLQSTL